MIVYVKLIGFIIKGYALLLWYYINKSYRNKRKELANKRILICQNCEVFCKRSRTCSICGCFLDIKTKMYFKLDENGASIDGCPLKKW